MGTKLKRKIIKLLDNEIVATIVRTLILIAPVATWILLKTFIGE